MSLGKFPDIKDSPYWKNWADKIIDGLSCQSFVEDAIQSYWYPGEWWEIPHNPCLFNIGGDPYDHSLELDVAYIDTEEKAIEFFDTKVSKEFVDFIAENGVKGFWINFYETEEKETPKKHEIHVSGNSKTLVRKKDENGKDVHVFVKTATLQ